MKYLLIICFIILILYGGAGLLFVLTIVHESYHKWDARDIPKLTINETKTEDICLMRYPSLNADYKIIATKEGIEEFEERRFQSEFVAYSLDFIIAFIWIFVVLYSFWNFWEKFL